MRQKKTSEADFEKATGDMQTLKVTIDGRIDNINQVVIPEIENSIKSNADNIEELKKQLEEVKNTAQVQYKIIANLTHALQDMEPACFSGRGYESVAGFEVPKDYDFAPDQTFKRSRRGQGCPVYPPAVARSSAGASAGGIFVALGVVVVVVVVVVAVIVIRRKKTSPAKGPESSEQGHQISFSNPLYEGEGKPDNGGGQEEAGGSDNLYDDFDNDDSTPVAEYNDDNDNLYDDYDDDDGIADDVGYIDVDATDDVGYIDVDATAEPSYDMEGNDVDLYEDF